MLSNECHWCLGERLYKANCGIQSAFKTVYKETLISRIQKAGEARPRTSEDPDRTSIEDFKGILQSSIFHYEKLPEHLLLSQTPLEIQK